MHIDSRIKIIRNWSAALLCGAIVLVWSGWASADPPSRVARLSYISGAVSFSPAGEDDWVEAAVNRPLITGDRLWVDNGARAELQVGAAVFYLGAGTSVTLLNLDNRMAQLQVEQGTVNARVRRLGPRDAVEIDTPNLAYSIRKPGGYRVDVDPANDATTVATRNGQAEVYGDGASYLVNAGQNYRFYGTDLRDYDNLETPRSDEFDQWSDTRYRRADNSVSARYVSRDVIGYEDLDDNGTWRRTAEYGNVWYPNHVAAGWAPYHDGHWAWVEPWGWTWVDDAPWGFAVSHYGRWANTGGNWGWVPGPSSAQPVYAPALVAFIAGAVVGAAISNRNDGNVGWFPLGPRDVYRPAYPVSRAYFNNVNTSNTTVNNTTITNVYNNTRVTNVTYVNQRVPGAVVAVPAAAFAQSRPVAKSRVEMPRDAAAKATVTPVAAVAPVQTSVHGGAPAGHRPPAEARARPVVAKERPPAAPVPFAAKERGLAAQPGRPLDAAKLATVKPAAPAPMTDVKVVAPPKQPAAAPPSKPAVARDAPRQREAQKGSPSDARKGPAPAETQKTQQPPEAQKGSALESKKGTPPPEAQKQPQTTESRKAAQPPEAQKGTPFERGERRPPETQKAPQPPLSAPQTPATAPRPPEVRNAAPSEQRPVPQPPAKASPPEPAKSAPAEVQKAAPPPSVPRAPEAPKAPPPEVQKAPQPPSAVARPPEERRSPRPPEERKTAQPPANVPPAAEERKAPMPPVNAPRPPEERRASPPPVNVPRPPEPPKAPPPEVQKAPPPPVSAPRPPEPPKAPPPVAPKPVPASPPPVAPKPAPPPPPPAAPKPPPAPPPAAPPPASKPDAGKAPDKGERKKDDKKDEK